MQIIESGLKSEMLRNMFEIFEDLIFDCDINVTVLNGYSTGTTAEKFNLNVVKAEEKLNSFKSN